MHLVLANTGEVLRLLNRSAIFPAAKGAAENLDQCVTICRNEGCRNMPNESPETDR